MKRHLTPEESDESRSKSHRILDSRNREDEDDPGGFLDLNATPRGFDLNAPVDEEENSHGQSGWLPAQDECEGKGDIIEPQRLVVGEVAQLEARAKVEIDTGASKSEDTASSAVPSDSAGEFNARETEEARINSKEEPDEPELQPGTESAPKLSVLAASILKRTLEPASNLGIDDDLDIIRAVWSAQQQNNLETVDTLVSEACEELSKTPSNPSRYHYLSCLYISKKLPEAFGLPKTFQVLVGILRNAAIGQPTGKRQMMLPVLASKLLLRAFASEPDWPLELVQVYLQDATMSRSWIEHDGCKEFVANILTAFPDVDVELSANTEEATIVRANDILGGTGELLQGQAVKGDAASSLSGAMPIKNRYPFEEMRARVRTEFLRALNQLLGSASTKENPRQLLKLLMQGAGYEEVRVVASSMLEGYLNNPVHLRAAKALLDRILQHTRGSSDNDLNTVANLLALRITSMQPPGQTKSLHGNIFGDIITQLVKRRPEFTTLALKTFVTAEVNNRNPHNLKSIVMVLKAMEESPPPEYELALILQELAANDDYRLQLRDLVRRMMKQVGAEIDVHALCHGLMQPWPAMGEQHEILKESWLKQLVDLSCQLLLHAAAPFALDENVVSVVISSSSSISSGASNASLKEKLLQVEKFSQDTASFQVEAVAWCTDVLAVYLPSMDESQFTHIVRQLLFLESSEAYFATNENVSEVDLVSFRLLSSCLPAPEEMLARLILMAISDYPVSQGEALKLIEQLVWRAAYLKQHMDGALTAASLQLPAAIFKLASFNLPGVIQSSIYQAQLVVKDMYWRACLVVLIIAAFNPSTIGWFVWENLPTIRCLMEALLTCTRTFLPIGVDKVRISEVRKLEVEAEQRDSKAEEAISAFLDVTEKRRNDPTSTDSETRGIPMLSPGSISTGQSGEWKGKVMFLNQTGPIRRPPKSAVDELDRVDATYRLGHLLRESRSPNFFAEITKQQTLPEAWPWLRRILVQGPDVITFLPPVWQCEMLFMHEGQHSLIRKLSLDVGKLLSCLRQVMVSLLQTNEGEIESVVGFLAHKLVANSGGVRVLARRCFSCLFDGPPSGTSDLNTSMPSSPQDSKLGDPPGVSPSNVLPPVKGGVTQVSSDNVLGSSKKGLVVSTINSQGPNMNTSIQIPSANTSSLSGGNSRVSPCVSHPSVTKDGEQDRASCTQASIARDDCKWLENVEKWPSASRVMRVLAPAIQRAVQQENSIHVVVAYFDFLKKCLSRTSLACCLATFIVHREMVASSLLLGPSSSLVQRKDALDTRHVSRAVTIDLIIDSICRAVESGTVSDLTELAVVQSPIVTLVLPRIAFGTKELALVRVKVHKVVVDATLEVLSLLGQEDTEDKIVKLGFQKLLNLLFPTFDNLEQTWRRDVDILGGWLEEGSGKRPLLSEVQAKSFARSKNTRLVKAGLSFLSLESKLELCESFGLSSKGATALLTDLNEQNDMRLEILLGSGSFTRDRLKKLSNCVRTIVKAEKKGDGNLLRILEHLTISGSVGQPSLPRLPTSGQEQPDSSLLEPSAVAFPLGSTNTLLEVTMDYVMECLAEKGNGEKFKDWQKFWVTPGYYVQLRKYLQTMMISGCEEKMNQCVMKVNSFLEKAESDHLANVRFLSFGLPIIALLSQYVTVSLSSSFNRVVPTPKIATLYLSSKGRSRTDLNLFDLGVQNSPRAISKMSGIFVSASVLLRNLEQKLVDLCSRSSADSGKEFSSIQNIVRLAAVKLKESAEGTMDTGGQDRLITNQSITSKMLELASVNRIEALLRIFLRQKLVSLWDEFSGLNASSGRGSPWISLLSKTLFSVLRKWRSRDGGGAEALKAKSSPTAVRDQVEYSGRYGLAMEILSFLDPEFQTEGLLTSILDMSRLQPQSRILPTSCTVPVALSCVLHQTSWNTLSKVFYLLLGTELNLGTSKSPKPGSLENGDYGRIPGVATSSFHGQVAVMEFITLCVQHPRSKLVCRQWEKSATSKLAWSWVDPSAARVLTNHAILACFAAKSGRDTETGSATSSNLWIQQYVGGLERRTLCPYKRCLKILLLAASQGSHITGAIVQQLTSYEEGLRDDFTTTITKTSATSTTRSIAQGFLQGLYLAFPVSVKAAMHSSDNKLLLIEERKSLSDIHSIQGQTCSLNGVMHSAFRSMCTGNEKESNAAYGFCQEFARQHPLLVMPHLLTLRLLLKELLPLLRQGEPQPRSSVVRAFMGGLGLLDALRPHVILNSNSIYTSSVISSAQHRLSSHRAEGSFSLSKTSDCIHLKTDLETILDLYFQILENLDIQDRSLLAKLVARFSDFLCHCVAAGGRSREYVDAHRIPILETTAQTYAKSKLKKIGFLLSLLDKAEVTLAEEMAPPASVISQPWNCLSHPQPASSSIVLDDILKVRTQLQQCIELYTEDSRKEQGLSIYSRGKPTQVSTTVGNNLEEGNFSATLNDLERASARMPAILTVFEDSLIQLTMVKDSVVRECIYNLLERSLLHCPSEQSASNIVQGLLEQLRSSDVVRAKSAARNASRFFHFSPELQESILVEMLQLGIVASDDLEQLLQGLISVADIRCV